MRDTVDRLHAMMIGVDPDLTLILDVEPAAGLSRARRRATDLVESGRPAEARYEGRGAEFLMSLRRAFLAIAAADPARCRLVDAGRRPEAVAEDIWQAVGDRLGA